MDSEGQTKQQDVTLWELAAIMAVTPERGNRTEGKSKHALPHRRWTPIWWVLLGGILLIALGVSFTPLSTTLLDPAIFLLRLYLGAFGTVFIFGGTISLLGDPVFQAITTVMRAASTRAWWATIAISLIISAAITVVSLLLLLDYGNALGPASVALAITTSTTTLILPWLAIQLAPPLLTTTDQPRIHQLRISQSTLSFTFTMFIISSTCNVLNIIFLTAKENSFSHDAAVLSIPISATLLGGIIAWHRRNIDRLEKRRNGALKVIGDAVDAFDLTNPNPHSRVKAVRELRRLVTPSSIRGQSAAAPPGNASYEVIEVIKLMEWATDPTGRTPIPDSITLRAEPGRSHPQLFSMVEMVGKEGVAQRSRAFLDRCYERLLTNSDSYK